jgi:hypothetical protein
MSHQLFNQCPEIRTHDLSASQDSGFGIPTHNFLSLLRDLLSQGIPVRFKASGVSMSPFIKNGDTVVVFPFQKTSPSIGQVVAFVHPVSQSLMVHRVLSRTREQYHLKGDNSFERDGLVPRTNILGYVKKVIRNGKEKSLGFGRGGFFIGLLSLGRLLPPFFSFFLRITHLFQEPH